MHILSKESWLSCNIELLQYYCWYRFMWIVLSELEGLILHLCPFKPKYLHIHYLPMNSFTNMCKNEDCATWNTWTTWTTWNICKNEDCGIWNPQQDDLRTMGTSRRDSSVSRGRHQLSKGGRQLDIKEEESPCLFFDIAATCDRGCSMWYFWGRAPLWSVLIIWHFVADLNVFFLQILRYWKISNMQNFEV